MSLSAQDNRQFKRIDTDKIVQVSNYPLNQTEEKQCVETALKNLSEGGALFTSEHKLNIGDVLELTIKCDTLNVFKPEYETSPGSKESPNVKILASVVRVELIKMTNVLYDIGVSYVGIDEADRLLLKQYLDTQGK